MSRILTGATSVGQEHFQQGPHPTITAVPLDDMEQWAWGKLRPFT